MDLNFMYDAIILYGARVLISLIVLFIGLKLINKFVTVIGDKFEKSSMEKSLKSFLVSIIKVLLQVVLIITFASMLGIKVTTFVAIIASAGFAIGLLCKEV